MFQVISIDILHNPVDGRVIVTEVDGLIPGQSVIIHFDTLQDDTSRKRKVWVVTRLGEDHQIREVEVKV